jgi:hypothetical protein
MWICVEMASLDPDQYWELGFWIQIQDSQNEVQKGKEERFKVKKRIDHFSDGFHLSVEILSKGFIAICDLRI